MGALRQMGQHQPLPVFRQRVGRTVRRQLDAAAPGPRLQQQMHLGIVAQRLIVADALHRRGDGFLIQNAALAEGDLQPETAGQQCLQNFQLYLAHELDVHLGQVVPPGHMELRVFVLQRLQGLQQGVGVGVGAVRPVVQHRLQQRCVGVRLGAQPLAGPGGRRTRHRHHHAGVNRAHQPELAAVIQPQGVGLLPVGQHRLHRQLAARDLQPAQPGAGVVLADLEHPGAEFRPDRRHPGQRLQALQQPVQPVQPQRRAEKAGKHLPPGDGRHQRVGVGSAFGQHLLHQRLAAERQRFGVGRGGKVHAAVPEPPPQLPQPHGRVGPRQVHLVHEHKGGHTVAGQQFPQGFGVGLHAVGAADHQYRVIQHPQGPLRLGGKIHVARRVQQRQFGLLGILRCGQRQHRLLGKNRDAPCPLLGVGIQKGVPVVHTAQLAQHPRAVEKPLGQRCLAAVHMGQQPNHQTFHSHSPLCRMLLLYLFSPKLYRVAVQFEKISIKS